MIAKIRSVYLDPEKALVESARSSARGEPVRGEEVALQGGTICVRDFVPLSVQGHPFGRLWIHSDITERVQAEARTRILQEITAAFSAAITPDQVSDVVLNKAARVVGAGAAGLGLVVEGGKLEVRSSLGIPDHVLAGWRQRRLDSRTVLTDVTRTGRTIVLSSLAEYAAAYPGNVPEVNTFSLQAVAGIPLRAGDNVLGAVTFIFAQPREFSREEVTFMKTVAGQAAQALERARLYGQLQSLSKQLSDNNEELREADRRKNEFLGVLSHELRNPLAPIHNSIHLLERAAPGSDQAARARQVIHRQTEHLTRLVDDLLDVTRITRGKVELQRARIDLREIVHKTTDDLLSLFDQSGVELRVEHSAGPVWVDADPTRIVQVIGNLLQNAVKFTPPRDGHRQRRRRREPAEIPVRDTGIGMEPDQVERMFEPFAQADHGLARTKGGLGLGLALVKGLVELHGGSVRGRSDGIGKGTEFTVVLRSQRHRSRPSRRGHSRRSRQSAHPHHRGQHRCRSEPRGHPGTQRSPRPRGSRWPVGDRSCARVAARRRPLRHRPP